MKELLVVLGFVVVSGLFANPVRAQQYTLEPSESSITVPVQLPYEGYGVNVLLKENGNLVMNQAGVSYQWPDSSIYLSVGSSGFTQGCPYDITAPCPNLHAGLRGIRPGGVTLPVSAWLNGKQIASTSIRVEVSDEAYTLEPSESAVSFGVGTGYGVNVLLRRDERLILDQQGVTYIWKSHNPSIVSISDSGFASGCPYNLFAPCPNLHADLYGLKPGSTKIEIEAWIGETLVEVTYIDVTVTGGVQTGSATPTAIPTATPFIPTPTFSGSEVIPNPTLYSNPEDNDYEGEQILRLERRMEELETRSKEQENLLQRILSFLKRFFRFGS